MTDCADERLCLSARFEAERYALCRGDHESSRRWFEHQHGLTPGFASRYGVTRLVFIEEHDLIAAAIYREKRIKKYPRRWKLKLIEDINPEWNDLSDWLI